MNLTDTLSGTDNPLPALGVENSTYLQVNPDGTIRIWAKKNGTWAAQERIGSDPSVPTIKNSGVTLTDAQIKALPTTAIEIVAAQGTNTIIVPMFAWLYLHWVADYTNIGDTGRIGIEYGANSSSILAPLREATTTDVSNLLADGASHPAFMPQLVQINVSVSSAVSGVGQFLDDPSATNASLKIYSVNSGSHTGNYTGGDTGNTLAIAIPYLVFNISTGIFQ